VESDAVRADIGQVMDDVDRVEWLATSTPKGSRPGADGPETEGEASSAGVIGARCHGDVTFVGTVSGQ